MDQAQLLAPALETRDQRVLLMGPEYWLTEQTCRFLHHKKAWMGKHQRDAGQLTHQSRPPRRCSERHQ